MSAPTVGERMTLRGGIDIECFEVYDDHGIPTGKWREIAAEQACLSKGDPP